MRAGNKQMESERRPEVNTQDLPSGTRETWPKVAIIVLNWNGWQDTIECLESLQRITYPNYQVIVVDNGSTDDSVQNIKAWARGDFPVESKFFEYDPSAKPVQWIEYDRETAEAGGIPKEGDKFEKFPSYRRLVLIQTGQNLGFSGGNNVAIRYALKRKNNYIWLLNNDTVVEPTALTEVVKPLEKESTAVVSGSKILFYTNPERIYYAGGRPITPIRMLFSSYHIGVNEEDRGQYDKTCKTGFITGCSMLIKKDVFEQIGLFVDEYFLAGEDADWCLRVQRAKRTLIFAPASCVWHKGSIATKKRPGAMFYYAERNAILLIRRYAPWFLPIVLLRCLAVLVSAVIRHRDRLPILLASYIDGFRGRTGPYELWHRSLQ